MGSSGTPSPWWSVRPDGQDDPRRTVPVRQRHAGAAGALPLDGVRTLRQAVALRAGARVLRHRQAQSIRLLRRSRRRSAPGRLRRARTPRRLIKEHRPGIVVVDSFKALRTFAADEAEFRRFLHELAGRLSALAVSSCGSASTDPTRRLTRPSSPSPTGSSRSRRGGPPNDRCATSASASSAAATSCPVTTCTHHRRRTRRVPRLADMRETAGPTRRR